MKKFNIFENSNGHSYIFIPVPSRIKKIIPIISKSDKISFGVQYNAIMNGDDIASRLMNMGQYIINTSLDFSQFKDVYVYSTISKEEVHDVIDSYFCSNISNEIYYNDYVTSESIFTGDYMRSLSSAIYSTIGKFSKNGDIIIVKLLI